MAVPDSPTSESHLAVLFSRSILYPYQRVQRAVHIMPQAGDVIVAPALVDTYAALNIVGIALLTLLTITFLDSPRKRLHRDPTLINAFVVLIWVGVWNTVYWMAVGTDIGVWESFQRPERRLCKVQSYVLAGSQPAQAATVFALTLRVRPGLGAVVERARSLQVS